MTKHNLSDLAALIHDHDALRHHPEPDEDCADSIADDWAGRLAQSEHTILMTPAASMAQLRLKLRFFAGPPGLGRELGEVLPPLLADLDRLVGS